MYLKLRTLILQLCALALGFAPLSAQVYSIGTVAGSSWPVNSGAALSIPFRGPTAVAQSSDGTTYVADTADNVIWVITPTGAGSILAGTGANAFGGDGGPATQARLSSPLALRLDGKGNLFVADYGNSRVRKIALDTGIITTVAGNGSFVLSGDGAAATAAGMDPYDVAVDGSGNLYIADYINSRIRKVTGGIITTFAGNGQFGFSGDGGPATNAILYAPDAVVVDSAGVVYIADYLNNRVRKVATTGVITTVAGNGSSTNQGDDGPATNASIYLPGSLALDNNGNLLILTFYNLRRLVLPDGRLERVTGPPTQNGDSGDGGPANQAVLNYPTGVAVGAGGDIIIADYRNFRIRRIRGNTISTIAGLGIQTNVTATSTFLNDPAGIVTDGLGGFWIGDYGHRRMRQVSTAGVISSTAGTFAGYPQGLAREGTTYYIADSRQNQVFISQAGQTATSFVGTGTSGFAGDGGRAGAARLSGPEAVAVDAQRNLYIADTGNCRIRVVDLSSTINTLAGTGTCGATGDAGLASQARVAPYDLTLANGNLYIAERANHRVRKIDLTTKIISTVAGTGTAGFTGDGGLAINAQLRSPTGIAVDAVGNLWIADWGNNVVRVVRNGTISTVAGNALTFVSNTDSGLATSVSFDPLRLTAAPDGSMLMVDQFNGRIRRLAVSTPTSLTISSGGSITGAPGDVVRLAVKITDSNGVPMPGLTVTFAVASGTATLPSTTAATDSTGVAFVNLTLGTTPGAVRVTATAAGLTPSTFNITIANVPVSTAPLIKEGGVVGAALSTPAVQALSSGAIATVFGQRFGAGSAFVKVGSEDLVDGKVPTVFKGICVEVAGVRAFVFGASDTQVNFQVPSIASSGNVAVRVLTGCGTAGEQVSNTVNAAAQAATPEFFYFSFAADGKNPVAATDAVTGAGIAPLTLFPGSGFQPTQPGKVVTVYGTGFGTVNPTVPPGEFFPGIAATTGAARVFLGGAELSASDVLYAGITPSSPGLFQLNIRIPAGTPAGNQSLVLQVGANRSPDGPFLAVAAVAVAAGR